MDTITRTIVLSALEKSEALASTEKKLSVLESTIVPSRESRALAYLIRIMKRERTKIEK